jgi:thiol-disulfide isomerase/thioredoxin
VIVLRSIAWLVVAAMLVAACDSQPRPQSSAAPDNASSVGAATQPPDARTPPTQLRFIAKTLGGRDFHGQSLLGKPAVLWFWAPWCPTCRSEAPMVGQVAASHPDVTFVGVAGLGQVRAMEGFVDKYSLRGFTQLADTDGTVWAKFDITQQPAFAFIQPDGSIEVVTGQLSEPELIRRVTDLSGH